MIFKPLNIVIMGSPDFGIPSFRTILNAGHKIIAAVTIPDKKKGRGQSVQFSDVKNFALEKNIPLLQPENLKDDNFIDTLKNLNADIFLIIAFRILPKKVFSLPRIGSINLHGSLLPKYRGAAPINHAIINGETETGVSTFFLKESVDTGNIILQKSIPVNINDTFGDVYYRLSTLGADVVMETLQIIQSENFNTISQDNLLASKAPKIFKENCIINWNQPSLQIHNFIRGLSPIPCAFTRFENSITKIYKSRLTEIKSSNLPGEIRIIEKKLYINTNDFLLEILSLKPEGKKQITALDFINSLHNFKSNNLKFH